MSESEMGIHESPETIEAIDALAKLTSVEVAQAIDNLIMLLIADAMDEISDRIEDGLGVRP